MKENIIPYIKTKAAFDLGKLGRALAAVRWSANTKGQAATPLMGWDSPGQIAGAAVASLEASVAGYRIIELVARTDRPGAGDFPVTRGSAALTD